jgi:quercetin dioxygenase-like cupin family protein
MKVIKYTDAPAKTFDADAVKGVRARVVVGKDDGASKFCMRVFEIEKGGYTPRHTHPWEHEIFVHQGQGLVYQNGAWVDVEVNSVVFIPGDEEHQIKNTGESTLVFVCLIPSGPPEI